MSKTTKEPEAVDWEAFIWHQSGVAVSMLATNRKVTTRTIQRRIKTVREYLKTTPGFEHGMDRLQNLVGSAFNVYETKIKGENSLAAARDVLQSTGFISKQAVIDDSAALRGQTDQQLIEEFLSLLAKAGNATILAEIKRFAISITRQRGKTSPADSKRAKTPAARRKTKVLGADRATRQRSTKRLPVDSKRPVRRRGRSKRKDGSRRSKGD